VPIGPTRGDRQTVVRESESTVGGDRTLIAGDRRVELAAAKVLLRVEEFLQRWQRTRREKSGLRQTIFGAGLSFDEQLAREAIDQLEQLRRVAFNARVGRRLGLFTFI